MSLNRNLAAIYLGPYVDNRQPLTKKIPAFVQSQLPDALHAMGRSFGISKKNRICGTLTLDSTHLIDQPLLKIGQSNSQIDWQMSSDWIASVDTMR